MQTNAAVEQNIKKIKNLDGPRVRGISPVGKKNVYGGKSLLKSQILSLDYSYKLQRIF